MQQIERHKTLKNYAKGYICYPANHFNHWVSMWTKLKQWAFESWIDNTIEHWKHNRRDSTFYSPTVAVLPELARAFAWNPDSTKKTEKDLEWVGGRAPDVFVHLWSVVCQGSLENLVFAQWRETSCGILTATSRNRRSSRICFASVNNKMAIWMHFLNSRKNKSKICSSTDCTCNSCFDFCSCCKWSSCSQNHCDSHYDLPRSHSRSNYGFGCGSQPFSCSCSRSRLLCGRCQGGHQTHSDFPVPSRS